MELKKKETDATYWHPAFFAGIQIELEEDADNLVFEADRAFEERQKISGRRKRKGNLLCVRRSDSHPDPDHEKIIRRGKSLAEKSYQ